MKRIRLAILTLLLLYPVLSLTHTSPVLFRRFILDPKGIGHREVGDIDGDGLNDIIALNERKEGDLIVWYRYPHWKKFVIAEIGKFKDYRKYRSCDMELGDLDGDGDLDIVGRIGRNDDLHGVNVWFENPRPQGDPWEGPWKRHDIGESPYVKDIEVADFDRDGKLDVVLRTHDDLYFWFQRDGGAWHKVTVRIHRKEGMEVGDLDRDGDLDVVLGGYWVETPSDPIKDRWVIHNIDEKWWNQRTGDWRDNCCKVAIADVNGDGRLDVILSHSEKPGYPVSWYEAPLDPKRGEWREHPIGQMDYCHSLKAADFDGDGDVDLLAAEMPRYTPQDAPVVIFLNRNKGLKWKEEVLARTGSYSAQIGDIGNDGDPDIIGLRNFDRPPIEIWENLKVKWQSHLPHRLPCLGKSARLRLRTRLQEPTSAVRLRSPSHRF